MPVRLPEHRALGLDLQGQERIAPPEYPAHLEVRRVSAAGTFRLKAKQPFLSNALADQYIGLEEVSDGLWNVVYYRLTSVLVASEVTR